METKVFIKNVQLTDGTKAVVKSKWQETEEQIPITIFVKENSSIFRGCCSQESLRKKKDDINVDYETIKSSLTSDKKLPGVNFELDLKKMKFFVSAEESSDSQSGFKEIYARMDVKKVEKGEELLQLTMEIVEDLSEMSKLKALLDKQEIDLKEMLERYEKLEKEKLKNDEELLPKFIALLNTKKKRIVELERELDQKSSIGFDGSSKYLNLSSDLERSDISQGPKTDLSSPVRTTRSGQSSQEPQPSTSTAIYNSPAKKNQKSRNSTPKSVSSKVTPPKSASSKVTLPKSASKSQRKWTPRKPKALKGLFEFEATSLDDSDNEILGKLKKSPDKINNKETENFLEGLKVKVTRKLRSSQEENPSSAELFAVKPSAKKRLLSSESETSTNSRQKSATPDIFQAAQSLENTEDLAKPLKRLKTMKNDKEKLENLCEKENDFTPDFDDLIPSSQALESPSIFESYAARKANKSPMKASQRTRKSVFSVDTQDIFDELSP